MSVCFSELQHVAVYCSVLQLVAVFARLDSTYITCISAKICKKYVSVLQCVVVSCSVLQCVVVSCSVLQCVVVSCSLLQ